MECIVRNEIIAVLGSENDFWLCKSMQNVKNISKVQTFKAAWLESDDGVTFNLQNSLHNVPIGAILRKIRLPKRPKTDEYILSSKLRSSIQKLVPKNKPETKFIPQVKANLAKKRKLSKNNGHSLIIKKAKVDKSNPNWKLSPRPEIKVLKQDPLFETKTEFPFVSTSANSHLVTRAVLLGDNKLLKKCLNDRKTICNVVPCRSLAQRTTPVDFALIKGHANAAKLIISETKSTQKRCDPPQSHLKAATTGQYNYASLSIRRIRTLQPSRGGREGNNAFTKDLGFQGRSNNGLWAVAQNVSFDLLNGVVDLRMEHLYKSLERGHRELAAKIMNRLTKESYHMANFSKFHIESLTLQQAWDPPIREVNL